MTDINFDPEPDDDDEAQALEVPELSDELAEELAEITSIHPPPPPQCIHCGHVWNVFASAISDCGCGCHDHYRFIHRLTRPDGLPRLPGE
jgi:hypothetical protein